MSNEENKVLNSENLDQVTGGNNEYGVTCPHCGSSNVRFAYDHDEIGVFDCNACGKRFSVGP